MSKDIVTILKKLIEVQKLQTEFIEKIKTLVKLLEVQIKILENRSDLMEKFMLKELEKK